MAAGGQGIALPTTTPWCLRLRDGGGVLGTGFLVASRLALTCRHVLANATGDIYADLATSDRWSSTVNADGQIEAPDEGPDVMLIRLSEPAPVSSVAPIGPSEPPSFGTILAAFGFPLAFPLADEPENPGVWARLVVDGFDMRGERIWLVSQNPHGQQVVPGLSGGPVIDPRSGLVVGMITRTWVNQRSALMIPVAALTASHPDLRKILQPRVPADPEFRHGLEALAVRNYPAALVSFRAVCARWPENPDTWYYVALAALNGQRPRAHSTAYVEEIDRLLEHAASLPSLEPHVLALWALIREDHYRSRGIRAVPSDDELRPRATSVSAGHAREICRHVPAPETLTWQGLNHRSTRGS